MARRIRQPSSRLDSGVAIRDAVASAAGNVDSSISALIAGVDRGDRAAAEALFGALYTELHHLAKRQLARSGSSATLGVTTLLHEAYLDIAERSGPSFPDRARFMGYMARVMRSVIIDYARNRQAVKRGGRFEITSLGTDVAENAVEDRQLSEISQALDELAKTDPELAEVVDLRFFCGFSVAEIAALSGTSERTVHRRWDTARIYLHRYLRPEPEP